MQSLNKDIFQSTFVYLPIILSMKTGRARSSRHSRPMGTEPRPSHILLCIEPMCYGHIILFSGKRFAQHLVGFTHFYKLFMIKWIIGVFIWMHLKMKTKQISLGILNILCFKGVDWVKIISIIVHAIE